MSLFLSYDPAKLSLAETIIEIINTMGEKFELAEVFKSIEQPPEPTMGDYALPCFKFAKALKKNPNQLAIDLKNALESAQNSWISKIELKGAFLNIFTNQSKTATYVLPSILKDQHSNIIKNHSGNDKTKVMIEFSQPNTHKEFHVGHGRNVCLGDSLCRLFTYSGYKVIAANYIGDEGAHIAKCLWGVEKFKGEPLNDKISNKAEWLGQRYVEANNLLKDATPENKEAYQKEISTILKSIESKSGKYYETWKTTRQYCLEDFDNVYKWLDVHFNHFFYESEVSEPSQKIVEEYNQKGLFVESQGAIGFDMSDKKLGFFMARKSDGTTLYITKDLALAKVKFNDFDIDRSIYVVGSEQNLHFKQLFYALEKMGFKQASQCYHLSYGMVVRPDGKMSSRAGNSFTFLQLIQLVTAEIEIYLEKYKSEWTPEQINHTSHLLAVGAIKYGMLQADPNKEIVFDPKEWVSFEGNSGPYLMYSYARTQSIISKARDQNLKASLENLHLLNHESEKELMRSLYDFNRTVLFATENYRPSTLATHLFFMCKSYNRFYAELSVLKAESNELITARLALLEAFAKTLKQGLFLLGITPPEKM